MANKEDINPDLLRWARESAELTVRQAAEKLGLKDTAKFAASKKLKEIEAGDRAVTATFLQRASTLYRRPLSVFYLAEPPARGERGEDFRTLTGSISARSNAMLDALVRDVRARQHMVREVLIDDDEAQMLPFVASADIGRGARAVADDIRATIGIDVSAQRRATKPDEMFSTLRTAAERIGVYVLLLGDLGSHHSDVGEEVFRGFALADEIAPFVVINDNDAVAARAFTLMHELAHIWIGASGVSGPIRSISDNAVERFCNDVAGQFLLPDEAVAQVAESAGADAQMALMVTQQVSSDWNVSQGVVAYRMARSGWITDDVATQLFDAFAERWRTQKALVKERRDPEAKGGPSYYVVRRSRLGAALLGVVRRALQGETLSHTKAAKILGVAPSSVDQLLRERSRAA